MNNLKIEKALRNAIHSAPSLPFEELATLPYTKMSEHDYITAQVKRKNTVRIRQFVLAAAFCLLVMLPLSNWYLQNRITDSIITLDVNPSIEIITNHKDKVLSLKSLNEDAQAILAENNYKDTDLEKMVTIILEAMVDNKYLDTSKNTILLTVMNKNIQKADAIMTEVDRTIQKSLEEQNITPTIMKQIISKESNRSNLAAHYHISEGKMNLILSMMSQNDRLSLDVLAKMSLQQLLRFAEDNLIDLSEFLTIEELKSNQTNRNPEKTEEDDTVKDRELDSNIESDQEKDEEKDEENEELEENEDSDENDDFDIKEDSDVKEDADEKEDSHEYEKDKDGHNRDIEKEDANNHKDEDNNNEEDKFDEESDRDDVNKEDDDQNEGSDSGEGDQEDSGDKEEDAQNQGDEQSDDEILEDGAKEDNQDKASDITEDDDEDDGEDNSYKDKNDDSNEDDSKDSTEN
jgi:hypothetical protein